MLQLARIRQVFPRPLVANLAAAVRSELDRLALGQKIRPGMRVAITGGSRGIRNIPEILRLVGAYIKGLGAEPFLVAAMGSHGGGRVQGQKEILDHYGMTEAAIGYPHRVTDGAVAIGRTESGLTAYCDAEAHAADVIFVCNRVKPHTSFRGPVESGLFKIMAVGLGKVPGATQVHKLGLDHIYPAIRDIGRLVLHTLPVVGGLAVLENAYDETARLVGMAPTSMEAEEEALLREAWRHMPALPVDDLDLLVVREIGKNFSGTGMDTNIIGRWRVPGYPEPERPRIKRLVALDVSDASGGNCNGVGLADFTTQRLVDRMDRANTYLNCMTSGFFNRGAIPIIAESDQAAIRLALGTLQLALGEEPRAALIANTLQLEHVWVSASVLMALAGRGDIELIDPVEPLQFDGKGRLLTGAALASH